MSLYEALLFLHIAAAIIWLGAGFTLFLLGLRATRAEDPLETKRLADTGEWLTPRLFIPSSLATLLLGVALVLEGPWGFGDLWILIGLAGFAASFLIGILVIEPTAKRISEAAREQGPGSPAALQQVRRIAIVSRFELAMLFVVAADMAIKPTGDDAWTLVLGALALVVAAVVAIRTAPAAPAVEMPAAPAAE